MCSYKRFHSWRTSVTEVYTNYCCNQNSSLSCVVYIIKRSIMSDNGQHCPNTSLHPLISDQLNARETDLRRSCLCRFLSLTIKYVQLDGNREVHSHWGRSWKQSQMPEVHPLDVTVWMMGLGWLVIIFVVMNAVSDLKNQKRTKDDKSRSQIRYNAGPVYLLYKIAMVL